MERKAQDLCAVLAWGFHDDCGEDGSSGGVGGEKDGVEQTMLLVLKDCDHDGNPDAASGKKMCHCD